jgi:hypothetical protein
MNIITKITGANIRLFLVGNLLSVSLSGEPHQVKQAFTLLYNYNFHSEWPSWYQESEMNQYRYMNLSVTKRHFLRGLVTLIFAQDTQRNGKHDHCNRMKRAIIKTAHCFKSMVIKKDSPIEMAID